MISVYRQKPYKKNKLGSKKNFKMSSLPKKDILRKKKISESCCNIQTVANPDVRKVEEITDKTVNHLIFGDFSCKYSERVLDFTKKMVSKKIH